MDACAQNSERALDGDFCTFEECYFWAKEGSRAVARNDDFAQFVAEGFQGVAK